MARKSLLKRAVSSVTAAAIAIVAMPVIPAFAETGATTYSFDGYDVEYSVKNEWTEGQSIEVKITNTGDEPILNWAFKYDAEGEINGLWNASIYDAKETSYIIKNAGWNYEIAPDESVSFGYTLSDYSGTNPNNFELCAKRVDKTEGYDVQYNITNEWDTGLQGEIVITNTSEGPIEFWQLSFDSDVTIDNIWNASADKQEESHYTISGGNTPINAGDNKTFGFIGTKTSELNSISNFSLSTVVIEGLGENGSIFNNGKTDENNTENNNSEENENVVSEECYPYTMFAASSDEGAITINADNFCVNGDIATNGTIVSSGNMNINGTRKENDEESMIFIFDKINNQYFSSSNIEKLDEDYTIDKMNIYIDVPTEIQGEMTLSGNININSALKALEAVKFYGDINCANDSVIFSEYGNIIIDGLNVNLNGLVYAPFGSVNIAAKNLNLNNVVIIADRIVLDSPNINVNKDEYFSSFVGTISEDPKLIHINKTNIILAHDNIYSTASDFNGFSGLVAMSDVIKSFVINVYDKNHTQIYTHDISPDFKWSIDDVGLIYGVNYVVFDVTYQDGFEYSEEIIIDCDKLNLSDYLMLDTNDDDEDGLINYLESYFGTDRYNKDTDGDGLSDNIEVKILSTDPLKVDTDNNGVSDADEDFDMDSLTNIQEIEIGSSPIDVDSDDDKLLDNEEMEHGTSLCDVDTDHDGISDYDEIYLGLSPLNKNDINDEFCVSFSANEECDEYDAAVIPTVEINGSYDCVSSFKMSLYDNPLIISPNMPGFVGDAYSFSTNTPFSSAKVSFALDYNKINITDMDNFEPVLYWLNEENNTFEEVANQIIIDNKIEANLEHFSVYAIINRKEFVSRWFSNFSISEEEFYSGDHNSKKIKKDVLFLIDQSGSMSSSDTNNIKTHIMDDFVNSISYKDRISVVGFNHTSINYLDFDNNKSNIYDALDKLNKAGNNGGTNIGYALNQTYNMFGNDPEDVYQCIFLISDGDSFDSPSNSLLDNYKKKGVKIFTVGLGILSTDATNELKRIASKTGGQYYSVRQSSSLGTTIIEFEKEISCDKDKNKDGIEDYYEYLMSTGELLTTTNEEICFGLYNSLMERGSDYDNDGLINGKEIQIVSINGELKVKVSTHPLFNDTDGDGCLDGEEVILGSDPNSAEDFVYMNDINDLGNRIESEIAADDYINSNFIVMIGERFLDVYVCGGEFNIQKRYQSVMVDYVSYYDNLTFDQSVSADMASNILTLIQRDMQLFNSVITKNGTLIDEYERKVDFINESRILFNQFRNTSDYKKGLNGTHTIYKEWTKQYRAIKRACGELEPTVEKSNRVIKGSKTLGIWAKYFCYAASTLDDAIDGLTLYSNTYNAVLLTELLDDLANTCGDRDIANAAQIVSARLKNNWELLFGTIEDCALDVVEAYYTMYGHDALVSSGPAGIIIEIVIITLGLAIGDNCSIRIQNSINVNFERKVDILIQNKANNNKLKYNNNNELISIIPVSEAGTYTKLFVLDAFANSFAEKEYLGFLNDNKWFIYKTDNSKENAKSNIEKINEVINKYIGSEIAVEN